MKSQKESTPEVQVSSMLTTAHASDTGVEVIMYVYKDPQLNMQCKSIVIDNIPWVAPIIANTVQIQETQPLPDEDEYVSDYLRMLGYNHHGDTTNFNELAAERIAYDVRDVDVPFTPESVELGEGSIILPGELRGFSEVYNSSGQTRESLEPISSSEAIAFICKVFSTHDVESIKAHDELSLQLWIKPTIVAAVELLTSALELMDNRGEVPASLLKHLEISEEEWARVRTSVKRDNVGDPWCYVNTYNVSEKDGTVEDQSRQNDRRYTTHEQYHTLRERIDGKFVISEELGVAARKNIAIYNSMYYKGGEIKNQKMFDSLRDSGHSHAAAKKVLMGLGLIATKGENKGWSERNVYYMRCAASRDEECAEKLWHVITWPLDIVEDAMVRLRARYKQSVMENRPGPGRAKINGAWTTKPYVGSEAVTYIKGKGVGGLKGKVMNKNFTLTIGDTWHKLFLSKKHMDILEDALLWRQGVKRTVVDGKVVDVPFNQTVESLPRDYVIATYSR